VKVHKKLPLGKISKWRNGECLKKNIMHKNGTKNPSEEEGLNKFTIQNYPFGMRREYGGVERFF